MNGDPFYCKVDQKLCYSAIWQQDGRSRQARVQRVRLHVAGCISRVQVADVARDSGAAQLRKANRLPARILRYHPDSLPKGYLVAELRFFFRGQ